MLKADTSKNYETVLSEESEEAYQNIKQDVKYLLVSLIMEILMKKAEAIWCYGKNENVTIKVLTSSITMRQNRRIVNKNTYYVMTGAITF